MNRPKRLKILFAADVLPDPDSGAAGTEYQTIQALRQLGHAVDEIWADDMPRRIQHGNLHYLLELPRRYRYAISRQWNRKQFDVVHVNQGHCWLAARNHFDQNRPGVFVCRSHGLDDHMEKVLRQWRRVLGIRNRSFVKAVPGRLIDHLLDRHMKLAARFVSGFIVSSSLDRQYLLDGHGMAQERVACIPQAPAEIFSATPAAPMSVERSRRVLYAANYIYAKGPHIVARAMNHLLSTNEDLSFTWLCRKEDHPAAASLLTPHARSRTRLLGWCSQEELCTVYDRHGIFLYPTFFDGFGKVFLEAMARGLCVVGTRAGGMQDIVVNGENGFLVDFADSAGVATIAMKLSENFHMAEKVSLKAIKTAEEYSWSRVGRETADFYKQLLTMPPRQQEDVYL